MFIDAYVQQRQRRRRCHQTKPKAKRSRMPSSCHGIGIAIGVSLLRGGGGVLRIIDLLCWPGRITAILLMPYHYCGAGGREVGAGGGGEVGAGGGGGGEKLGKGWSGMELNLSRTLVMQCLLLLTGMHHSAIVYYSYHSWRGCVRLLLRLDLCIILWSWGGGIELRGRCWGHQSIYRHLWPVLWSLASY